MSDAAGQTRPSFAEYWRRQDEGKPLVFVAQEPQPAEEDDETEQTAQQKAQRRRAQVRKAQLQHRERKATYTKQLELDATQIRHAAERVARRCEALRRENDEMRGVLARAGAACVLPSAVESCVPVHRLQLERHARELGGSEQASCEGLGADKTVSLVVDKVMEQACYQIVPEVSGEVGPPQLPAGEEDVAINFILALEHICWDHFHPSDFLNPELEESFNETGHALMASTFCAATAPEALYPLPKEANIVPEGPSPSWGAGGLTLQNLRLLASSLTPGDAEVTPVQVWFELVERYGAAALLGEAMEALKREFVGVVKCPHFGAVLEREAFESVVGRVMARYPLLPYLEEGEG